MTTGWNWGEGTQIYGVGGRGGKVCVRAWNYIACLTSKLGTQLRLLSLRQIEGLGMTFAFGKSITHPYLTLAQGRFPGALYFTRLHRSIRCLFIHICATIAGRAAQSVRLVLGLIPKTIPLAVPVSHVGQGELFLAISQLTNVRDVANRWPQLPICQPGFVP